MTEREFRKQYGSLPKKEMTRCFNELPINDRTKFLGMLPDADRKKFIKEIREQAVKDFWTHEQALIKEGKCTRDWTPEQVEEIFGIITEEGPHIFVGPFLYGLWKK